MVSAGSLPQVERFGARRKGEAVQRLCWAGPPDAPEARADVDGVHFGVPKLQEGYPQRTRP